VQNVNERGREQFFDFWKKKTFLIIKANFSRRKAFFFKTEIELSTFQDAGHNLNGAPDMAYSKFDPDYEL